MALSDQLISGHHLWWGRVPEIGDRQRATHSVVAVIAAQAGYPVILVLLYHFNVITAESIFDVFAILVNNAMSLDERRGLERPEVLSFRVAVRRVSRRARRAARASSACCARAASRRRAAAARSAASRSDRAA